MKISEYLEEDHRRIERILQEATGSGDRTEPKLNQDFRGALLRHIGMEEKILFPAIRNATGGGSLPGVEQLHLDHGALAALLVPTPTASILGAIRTILRRQNVIEEGATGYTVDLNDCRVPMRWHPRKAIVVGSSAGA